MADLSSGSESEELVRRPPPSKRHKPNPKPVQAKASPKPLLTAPPPTVPRGGVAASSYFGSSKPSLNSLQFGKGRQPLAAQAAVQRNNSFAKSKPSPPPTTSAPPKSGTFGSWGSMGVTEEKSSPAQKVAPSAPAAVSPTDSAASEKKKFKPNWIRKDAPPNRGTKDLPCGNSWCLSNLKFVITGTQDSLTRDEMGDLIKQYGGLVAKSVSGMTSFLVAGDGAGESKKRKAQEKHVQIIDEDGLFNLINTRPAGKRPRHLDKARQGGAGKGKKVQKAVANPKTSSSALWVEKYRPVRGADLVGNPGHIRSMETFLKRWPAKPGPGFDGIAVGTGKKGGPKRAVLLSGPPGIGKTTSALIIARGCGYKPVELNASDARSKKGLKAAIGELLNNRSMGEFFKKKTETKINKKRTCLVMDECDGMSGGDRGGMQELIAVIKKTKIPIICICNDRQHAKVRTLANHCHDLKFRRPNPKQCLPRLMAIARTEGFNIDHVGLERLAEQTNGDIRQMLNLLQLWSNSPKSAGKRVDGNTVRDNMKNAGKDCTKTMWDVAPQYFQKGGHRISMADGINNYFVDMQMMPLLVQENYLGVNVQGNPHSLPVLNQFVKAAECISDSDIVGAMIGRLQYYALAPMNAVLSCYAPGQFAPGPVGGWGVKFPQWFGKNSKRKKFRKWLTELKIHMQGTVSSTETAIAMQYVDALRSGILKPLVDHGEDGFDAAIDFMNAYHLSREDYTEVFQELGAYSKIANKSGQQDCWIEKSKIQGPLFNIDRKAKRRFTLELGKGRVATYESQNETKLKDLKAKVPKGKKKKGKKKAAKRKSTSAGKKKAKRKSTSAGKNKRKRMF